MEEKTIRDEAEGAYELDLDDESGGDVDDVMRDALDAVERVERDHRDGRAGSPAGDAEKTADGGEGGEPIGEAPPASEEAAQLRDRLVRTLADFDNFRKRTEREKQEMKRYAAQGVWKDILDVVDNLERAHGASGGVDELKTGLEMVLRQLAEVMRRYGVQTVAAEGQPFDPQVHEAVAREESDAVDVPTVTGELQKGYTIHDRLLRPAMVHVTMPVKPARPTGSETAAPADDAAN